LKYGKLGHAWNFQRNLSQGWCRFAGRIAGTFELPTRWQFMSTHME
jgi:hypothetical protein